MPGTDREADASRLSSESYARGEPTAWFDRLYAEAASGRAIVPWDRGVPNAQLVDWAAGRDGSGKSAVIVGCGLGNDAEFVAGLGYRTTGFDLSATAVAGAKQRYPQSSVIYEVADLFALPERYRHAFDLVIECYTVQSLPDPPRGASIAAVSALVAPGGTLLVVAFAGDADNPPGPPFPLTRREIAGFAVDGLTERRIEDLVDENGTRRWRAEYRSAQP